MDLQTQRLVLRTPIPDDDEFLISLFTDPKTMHHLPIFLSQPWDASLMAARRESRAQEESLGRARNFTILLRDVGFQPVIGQAGYRTLWMEGTRKRGEFGLILAHAQQGRGLAWDVHLLLLTVGFEELGLEVVEWVTAEANESMRAVLVKMGCKDEGVFVEVGRDQWGTLVKYSLEKKDWADCKVWLQERVNRLAGS